MPTAEGEVAIAPVVPEGRLESQTQEFAHPKLNSERDIPSSLKGRGFNPSPGLPIL